MSISLIFPLVQGYDGFKSFTDAETKEAIQQNLKMLLLTRPGEYVMDSNFGVGLHGYLFELANENTSDTIKTAIRYQISKYMPYVLVENIDINLDDIDNNVLKLRLIYRTSESTINEVFDLITST